MKALTSILLVFVLIFSLASCGGKIEDLTDTSFNLETNDTVKPETESYSEDVEDNSETNIDYKQETQTNNYYVEQSMPNDEKPKTQLTEIQSRQSKTNESTLEKRTDPTETTESTFDNKTDNEVSIPYTTASSKYTVSIKIAGSNKSVTLTDKDAEYIGKVVTATPVSPIMFYSDKDYIITVNGKEYYYDISSGELGNTSVKTLSGDVKEQFDSILISSTK